MTEGPFMFVHEVTGTYLETDNYNDNIGEAVQTWNEDPPAEGKRGAGAFVVPGGDLQRRLSDHEL
jgi:hypothetical protein